MRVRVAVVSSEKFRFSFCRLFILSAAAACIAVALVGPGPARAQSIPAEAYGPYHATFLPDGPGLTKKLSPLPAPPSPFGKPDTTPTDERSAILEGKAAWTLAFWFHAADPLTGTVLVAGIGDPAAEDARFIGVEDNRLALWLGQGLGSKKLISGAGELSKTDWHFAAMVSDGAKVTLYADGKEVATSSLVQGKVAPRLEMASSPMPAIGSRHFGGEIAGLKIYREELSAEQVRRRLQSAGRCRPMA